MTILHHQVRLFMEQMKAKGAISDWTLTTEADGTVHGLCVPHPVIDKITVTNKYKRAIDEMVAEMEAELGKTL